MSAGYFRSDDSIVSSWVFGPYEGGISVSFGPYTSTVEGPVEESLGYGPYKNGQSVHYSFESTIESDSVSTETSQYDHLYGPYNGGTSFNFVTNQARNT